MSAPSLLDSRGRPGHDGSDTTFATGYSRRTGLGPEPLDPLDRLALRLSTLCCEAVDPLAIAAGLEAEGHNDRLAQERHDLPDLFALAEELYRRVPRGGGHTETRRTAGRAGDRAGSIARPLLRGSLFAVPALCGLALLPPAGRTGTAVRLGIALIQVVAWGYGQGIAHAAYARLNAGDRQAARMLLRTSTVCALVGQLGLFTLLAVLTRSAPTVILPTATALGYCLAAVPALVLGAELQLAAVLIPIGLATLTWTFALHQAGGSAGAAVIAGAAVLGTLWLAWRLTGSANRSGADRSGGSRLERLRQRRWLWRRVEGSERRRFRLKLPHPARIRLPESDPDLSGLSRLDRLRRWRQLRSRPEESEPRGFRLRLPHPARIRLPESDSDQSGLSRLEGPRRERRLWRRFRFRFVWPGRIRLPESDSDQSGLSRLDRLRQWGHLRSRPEGSKPRRFRFRPPHPARIRLPSRAAWSQLFTRVRHPTRRRTPDRSTTTTTVSHRGSGWAVGTMPQALYGSCVGIWLLLVLVGPLGTGSTAQLHAAATLTLSMGAAEWHYAWYRQAMRRSLAANHELGGFARRAVAVLTLALTRQALTTALLAGSAYALLDRHSGGIDCYLFALALSPGLLAATVIRPVAARGLLALTVSALAATGLVQPLAGSAGAAEVACGYALALAVAAARFSTRPWTNI